MKPVEVHPSLNEKLTPGKSPVVGTTSSPGALSAAAGATVVLRFDDQTGAATLRDTPEARQLAAMLPITVDLTELTVRHAV